MNPSNHNVTLYISGKRLDLGDDGLALRMSNVLLDPSSLAVKQAEYSFTFQLPSTPANDAVFGYASNTAKPAKYGSPYDCEVYADETLIFSGTLMLRGYKDGYYDCNLVSPKVYSIDNIFGETPLDAIDWKVEYSGATSINSYNNNLSSKVFFPFVAYGVFEKEPFYSDEVADDYTDARELDKYARYYPETFMPSLNLVETVRRCFEYKGYTLNGDIFDDEVLNNIFMSTSLAQDQVPTYNLANPLMGSVDISLHWSNGTPSTTGHTVADRVPPVIQNMNYPYFMVHDLATNNQRSLGELTDMQLFNWSDIDVWNMFGSGATVTENHDTYMFDPGEQCVVIPADGWYKIEMEVDASLLPRLNNTVTGLQQRVVENRQVEEVECVMPYRIADVTPFEIQLVRNVLKSDEGATIELIRGKQNKEYLKGIPFSGGSEQPARTWTGLYPHEWTNPYFVKNPTTSDAPSRSNGEGWPYGSQRGGITADLGYVYKNGEVMGYDPCVSPYFICGFSTMSNGVVSVMKDGRGWYAGTDTSGESMYSQSGYQMMSGGPDGYGYRDTSYGKNAYEGSPTNYCNITNDRLRGKVFCCVYLLKNDVLTLNMVHRHYDDDNNILIRNEYFTSADVTLKIDALSPNSRHHLDLEGMGYHSPSEFDADLQLGGFLNSGTTMQAFVSAFVGAFNLKFRQSGNEVFLDEMTRTKTPPVNLESKARIGSTSRIDYPSRFAVQWSVDTDEYGFWTTVPLDKQNGRDWEQYGDSGYTEMVMDPLGTEEQTISLPWSYNWYDTFNMYKYSGETVTETIPLELPVIGPYRVLAPGAVYGDAMKEDCLSMPLRLWYRRPVSSDKVTLTSGEDVYLAIPAGNYNGAVDLSYKDGNTLLGRYFSVSPDISANYATVEVYLTPEEYVRLKNGAEVRIDDNLYTLVEISGYDPLGNEPTELKLMST